MSELFVIIIEDRHSDVDVEVHDNEDRAVGRAKRLATEYCRHAEDLQDGLTDGMKKAGWVYYCRYSCESDSVRVVKAKLITEQQP